MAKYSALAARALALIRRKGGSGTLTRPTATVDEVAQTRIEADTSVTFSAVAVNVDIGRAQALFGAIVGRDIARLYIGCYGLAMTPRTGDRITWGGSEWSVLEAKNIDPDGALVIVSDVYMER